MNPFTFFAVLSSMVSAGASIQAGRAEAKAFEDQAQETSRVGEEKSRVAGLKGRRTAGSQMAGFGAAGVEQAGSPLMVMMETLGETMREQESILAGARVESSTLRKKAKQSRSMGYVGAAESLLPGLELLKD